MANNVRTKGSLYRLCLWALFIAIELVMWGSGIGSIPIGALRISFITVPTAIGAILMGPLCGAVLGFVHGLTSFYDAVTGTSGLASAFFALSPFMTMLLCVGMRTLEGLCVGFIFKGLRKIDHTRIVSYYVSSFFAPFLNTVFFMGFIVLFFFQTEAVQASCAKLGVTNPILWIAAVVGIQAVIEWLLCTIVGGTVSKGVAHAMKMDT